MKTNGEAMAMLTTNQAQSEEATEPQTVASQTTVSPSRSSLPAAKGIEMNAPQIDLCPGCGKPCHATEGNEDGYHPQCIPSLPDAADLIRRWYELDEAKMAFVLAHPEPHDRSTAPVAAQWSALVAMDMQWRKEARALVLDLRTANALLAQGADK